MLIKPKRMECKVRVSLPEGLADADFTPKSLSSQLRMNVVVSTVDRPEGYVHSTLASMLLGGMPNNYLINLIVSSDQSGYLEKYKHHKNLRIICWDRENWSNLKLFPRKFMASYNYIKCLSVSDYENSLVFEDDVVFQNDWFRKMMVCLNEIENDGYEKYIFSLLSHNKCRSSKNYFQVPKMTWAGTQAVFYPKSGLGDIRNFMEEVTNSVSSTQVEPSCPDFLNAYDMIVKEWSMMNDCMIFSPVESLVQHIGYKTSGGTGENIIRSPVFLDQ